MPGKRVEFRPTVLVCDGSPERLHDSTPRPQKRAAPARPAAAEAPASPMPLLPTAVVVPVRPPVAPAGSAPRPASCPAIQQAREALLAAPTAAPPQPPVHAAPAGFRDKTAVAASPTPQQGVQRVRSDAMGAAVPPATARGRGDGADDRRCHTLPTPSRGSAPAAAAPPAAGALSSASRAATWRTGQGAGGGGGGTLPARHRHVAVPPRPRSVPGTPAVTAAAAAGAGQSPQCFQCAGGARCLPSSAAAADAPRDSAVPWPQRWRHAGNNGSSNGSQLPQHGHNQRRSQAAAPPPTGAGMPEYQYCELSGAGGERRTWVKPTRNGTNGVRVEGERVRATADSASAACLLNHEAGVDGISVERTGAEPVRIVGWICRSQVIAFICGLIVLLLMALALASSDWLLSDGWRQGLFAHCTEEDAGRPLPFNLPFEPGCHRARSVPYIIVSEALAICCMLLDAFATLMAGLGLWSKDTNKKYQYYRAAVYVMIISLISILIALVVYPVCFAQELEQSNRTVWEFGWAYGVGWGAAIFLFGGVILLLCDKESEEIYYKERTIMHDERA